MPRNICIVADVHIGNHKRHGGAMNAGINTRCQQALDVFDVASKKAGDLRNSDFIVAGDLVDSTSPSPQILAAVSKIYRAPEVLVPSTHIIVGNHERVSGEPGDHSLGVFSNHTLVHEKPVCRYGVIYVPHQSGVSGKDMIKNAMASLLIQDDLTVWENMLMVCHVGIEDSTTPPWLKGKGIHVSDLRKICEESGIEAVVAGDWHEHRMWSFDDGPTIVQCGALVPTGWDNPSTLAQLHPENDPYGSFIVWDPRQREMTREVLPGPRFVKTNKVSDARAIVAAAKAHGHQLYLEVTGSIDALPEITNYVRGIGWDGPLSVIPDKKDVAKRVKAATMSVTNADSMAQAVTGYVESAPFEGNPDRSEVASRVLGALKS